MKTSMFQLRDSPIFWRTLMLPALTETFYGQPITRLNCLSESKNLVQAHKHLIHSLNSGRELSKNSQMQQPSILKWHQINGWLGISKNIMMSHAHLQKVLSLSELQITPLLILLVLTLSIGLLLFQVQFLEIIYLLGFIQLMDLTHVNILPIILNARLSSSKMFLILKSMLLSKKKFQK